ncbi:MULTISPECIES: mammalian cell entry protein [Mycobacterium]|jgi:Mce-associated membrane protein|uniref:Mammalian cell entry protein n=1 Tax=Mycobacterium colombiense TaxID=339268 RepID=A0A329M3J5_9MYCO|nr:MULTISPECIES: mammalian cell entry protein [Mycobacterium]MDM4140072.1 mammalian cell entry protein [Mycobacterium sp. FLAC0960]RAV14338.1 mammalian cell entry protein [Mycobacterium colombiense]
MDTAVADEQTNRPRVRRRASRAAGPAKGESAQDVTVRTDVAPAPKPPPKPVKALKSIKPPPRRQPHRALVGWISFAAALLAVGALVGCVAALLVQQRHATSAQARDQRFVDTATQTVVNMFSYKQDNIDESVNRFINGTSGPLRGMLGANNNAENLKALFRSTNATSEAVINGAALEGVDAVTNNASVLVSVRVTVADIDGVNKPSMPYRLRVIVHEDDAGKMSGYDLKYPDGGN